ncbi:MAG: DNA gyrase/topoisomerase IV subunit A [Dysgonamonadaceae bacterium]|jgi:topoisomerase-4 subunit A|nr:DNA gyrase/topoisomerase IV subunit A [Dysgonamonadaceae bacterium]
MSDYHKENIENEDSEKEHPDYHEDLEKKHSGYQIPANTEITRYVLSGMYQNWFLDYASYVILDRAVPHINDGLKPVQRRILHTMWRMEDGRYNKVAGIVGEAMKFHPHGDASIGEALVQLGQKDLLIDCQGNWGNILTGKEAAAPRYIEARLSKFALEVVFNPKTTEWKLSYDGRNKEPKTLPVKFPLLLLQGVEGIAVGLSSKVLPHNFNELLNASVAYLKSEDFILYPDFQTGGYIDVSRYNDGERGGSVKVRAKISKTDNKTLCINEIPFGKTTGTLTDSILKAAERGKIKIRKVENITAENAEIIIHLAPGVSSDKTIDALYAFTDCEISISPNCCIINENKPHFMTVSDILRHVTDNTLQLLKLELEIQRGELLESLHFASLEKIFIEERIYKDKEFENAGNMEIALSHVDKRLKIYFEENHELYPIREINRDDLLRLLEIKMGRILKFNKDKADSLIASYRNRIKEIDRNIEHIVDYTIDWFTKLKDKYGHKYSRRTEIRNFDTIEATKVVEANEKLYINRDEGFIGFGLKKDEYVCNCSDIDEVIIFYKDGKYRIVKISEKMFVGKNILYLNVFKRNDNRTVYNVIYRDGKTGPNYIKRFSVTGVTRDKEYDLTNGTNNSRILYFSANNNGEAESVRIILKPKPRQKILVFDKDFSDIQIKGRGARGVTLTKAEIHKISLKRKGDSTLGGRQVWFDPDVQRLNYDGRGKLLGEFFAGDLILVIEKSGRFYTTNFEETNHYEGQIVVIEKFNPSKTWSAVLFDKDQQGYPYLKRFAFETSMNKKQSFIGGNPVSSLILVTDAVYPRIEVKFGRHDSFREPFVIDVEEFIGIKSLNAKGKRISTYEIAEIREIEPNRFPEPEPENPSVSDIEIEPEENGKQIDELIDEITGQQRLF